MSVRESAEQLKEELISWRRQIHAHPEVGWHEVATGNMVAAELEKMGIEVTRVAKTGVLGVIKGTAPGRTVALRADMDALPITEANEVPYKSQNPGVMHACGHDGHTAMLLGAAKILSQMREKIKGTVKLFFQPSEEIGGGALAFIEAGAIEGVDAILALHLWPNLPSGKVSLVPGPRMASADKLFIKVRGKAGHGSMPHQGVDAILAAAAITMNLQSIVSREVAPLEPAVVTIGRFTGGTTWNIVCDEVELEGTTRCFSREIRDKFPATIERIIKSTAASYRAEAELEYVPISPPTINDPLVAKVAAGALTGLYGEEALGEMEKVMGGEDFAYFLERIPGAMVFVGVGNKEKGTDYPLHNERYNLDEDVLPAGAALHAQFALDFLSR
ncbi:M20 metallopeptidase family protein [Anaeroselena agilis]|uniref:M20 family metallopeptidase n=1 Tax=Anaeroselena agilis TaxID=3063788 RepID=A0ABU3P2E7_9FIRM|nr:M20 family metallopeptidase [Selenomonadales bacterium 4137-cl]